MGARTVPKASLPLWNIKTAYVPPLRALARYFPSSTAAASACTNPSMYLTLFSLVHVDVCCDDKSIDIAQIIQTRLKSNPCIQLPEESTWWTSDKVPEGPSISEVSEQAEKLYFESVKAIRDNVMLMIDRGVESRAEDIRLNLDEGMWLGIRGSLVTGYSFRESNPWMLGRDSDVDIFMVVPDNTVLTRPRFVKSGNAIWLAFCRPNPFYSQTNCG